MRRQSVARTVLLTAVVVGLSLATVATVPTSVAATPDTDCAGGGGGALFVADSGFTVEYNDSEPMPEDGVFRSENTMRFRNVTLASTGESFLRLEDGTGPKTCLAAVNATPATVSVDPDGEQAVLIDGEVDALSLADADYDSGTVDLAYEASGEWILTLPSTGLDEGTEIVVENESGTELTTATVDASGELVLSLPAGDHAVDLREPTSQITVTAASTSTSAVLVNETVNVSFDLRNDGGASGEYTATLTVDGQDAGNRTVLVGAETTETFTIGVSFTQAGTYSLAVDGEAAGNVTVSEPTPNISVTSASTATSSALVGENVAVTVDLRNDGDASGEYTATLTADGQAVTDQTVTVDPGSTATLTLTTSFDQAGNYDLAVDGQDAGTVTVSEPTAQITVTSATAQTSDVRVGENVVVTVDFRNDGDASGNYTATLTADGQAVRTQTAEVDPGSTATLTLTTSFAQAGTYDLAVDGQDAGTVTVSEVQTTAGTPGDTTTSTVGGEQGSSDDGGLPWLLLLGIVAVIAAVGGYLLAQREAIG